ncbi:MAG: TraR/DksA family transcriptional regulator [Elusimicrobia bacterium]|nr:TraR/DksA family transcriptional regulator [Candidatus Liberimonas magnetica]
MNQTELKKLRKLLLEKRDDLTQVVKSKKERDLQDVEIGDEIDSASQSVEKEILFELTDNEKVMLDNIESALSRIEKGTFGKCESCGQKIAIPRLEALPWVRYCISCQAKTEKA